MDSKGRTIALRAFCRVCPDSEECKYVGRRTKCDKYSSFSLMMTNEQHIYERDNVRSKCGEEKSINDLYNHELMPGGKYNLYEQCIKEYLREQLAEKRGKGIKAAGHMPEEAKENNRIRAQKDYYNPEKQYLLKKYLKRHEIQLKDWTKREKDLYTRLSQTKNYNEKKKIIQALTTAKLKIEHLQEKIREETKELNNNNTYTA